MSNIIRARFTKGVMAITEPQYQFNYGQILKIEGVELSDAYLVHFSNERLGNSITAIGNADGVRIPDQFFHVSGNIYAWVFLHEGLEDGETAYLVMIPVKARAAITDEEPTPEEQSTISQIIEALNSAVDKAEDAITKYPTIVDGYWYVWDAVNEQWFSTNVKATGEQGIQGLKGLKGDKGLDYILTAADKVEIAEIVEDDVNNAVYNVYPNDKASGTVASFIDGADEIPIKSLTVSFEPEQDLHGFENPWIGGTGINLNPTGTVTESTSAANRFYIIDTISLTAGTYYVRALLLDGGSYVSGLYLSVNGEAYNRIADNGSTPIVRSFTLEEDADVRIYLHSSTIPDGSEVRATLSKTLINEFIPYENICPITGHTGFNMYKAGGNLLCKTVPVDAITSGTLSTGDTTISSGSTFRTYCVYVGKNTNIRFRKYVAGTLTIGLAFADEYITERQGSELYNTLNMANRENNTLNSGEHPYLVICVGRTAVNDGSYNSRQATVFFKNDNALEVFSPTSDIDKFSYDWEDELGTVYSAILNVLTGVLTIDMVCRQVTASYLSSVASGYIGYSAGVTALGGNDAIWVRNLFNDAKERKSGGIKAKCNAFDILMNSTAVSSSQDRTAFSVDGTAINSVETFIEAVHELESKGEGLYVAYELATPIDIQLEAHELASIYGGNQIWSDTGTVEVEYRADTDLYVDRKIKEAISALS